ncbi:Interferon-induced very large GTPase 1 (Interferon-induced very large GTPase pseudogene 1) [Durusdinium trenchii]
MQQEFRLRGKPDVDVLLATSYLHKEVVQFLSHSTALKDEDAIVEAYANLVRKGMPFEIVDGEHLHFPQAFLRKLFNSRCLKKFMQKKPLEVCSTIGPQSSGKSTLSNHLYGSRFGVSVARCTRGIFGSFHFTDGKVMLILDTEGLQSAERADPKFDRIMMLFIFAVSNRIDITIKGNMTEPMKKLVQVCAHSLQELEMNKVPHPSITWIMNQESDPKPTHHEEAFAKMFDELKDAVADSEVESLREVLRLDEPSIAVVPTMSSSETFVRGSSWQDWTCLRPSDEFSRVCAKLASEKLGKWGQTSFAHATNWLGMAEPVLLTIMKFPSLTDLSDVKHLRDMNLIEQWIESNMTESFYTEDRKAEHQQARDSIWNECAKGPLSSFQNREELVRKLKSAFQKAAGGIEEKLANYMNKYECEERLRKEMSSLLSSLLGTEQSAWVRDATHAWEQVQVRDARSRGAKQLNAKICNLLRGNSSETKINNEKQANQVFEEVWVEIIKDMESKFDRSAFENNCLQDIYDAYPREGKPHFADVSSRAQTFTKGPPQPFRPSEDPTQALDTPAPSKQRSSYKFVKAAEMPKGTILGWTWKGGQGVSWDILEKEVIKLVNETFSDLLGDQEPRLSSMRKIHDRLGEDVVKQVNGELQDFGRKLSLNGCGDIVSMAMIHTWKRQADAAWEQHMQPIEEFKADKEKQRKYFCTQVLQRPEADAQIAQFWIAQIVQRCRDQALDSLRALTQKTISKEEQTFTRKSIQSHLDNLLVKDHVSDQEKEKQFQYIENPKEMIEEELQSRFEARVSQPLAPEVKNMAQDLKRMLNFLLYELKEVRDRPDLQADNAGSQKLLDARNFVTCDPSVTEDFCKQALGKWLVAYLTKEHLPSKWKIVNGQLEECEEDDGIMISEALRHDGSPVGDAVLRSAVQAVSLERVGNLHFFVKAAVDVLDSEMELLEKSMQSEVQEVTSRSKKEFKYHLIPCSVRCPCCERLCDNPDPNHTVHRTCWHLPRGLRGRQLLFSSGRKIPSTLICTEMKDETQIKEPDGQVTWKELKERHSDWDFSVSDAVRPDLEAKSQIVWERHGPRVCERFGLQFTKYGERSLVPLPPRHYLLILDGSGSMHGERGEKWQALQHAVRKLIPEEEWVPCFFSIVVFSTKAKIVGSSLTSVELSELLTTLKPPFQSTDFAAAFQSGTECVQKEELYESESELVVVFMSDGQDGGGSDKRKSAIAEFAASLSPSPWWSFYSIAFGLDADKTTLREIADFIGKYATTSNYKESVDGVELADAFVEIAQSVPGTGCNHQTLFG